ncbi:type IV pilus modification protein PilV [Hydrogenophaga sp. A37]
MLIEVLITMFVVAIGLLGAAGLQLASTRFQQTSSARTEALLQADFIIEKMRVNSSILTRTNLAAATITPESGYLAADDYDNADDLPANPGCGLSGQLVCTAAQAAQRDLREWRESLARSLPGGRGSLFPVTDGAAATEANARRVVVMWREKAQLETDTQANLNVDPTDPSCPPPLVDGVRCLNLWVTP